MKLHYINEITIITKCVMKKDFITITQLLCDNENTQ